MSPSTNANTSARVRASTTTAPVWSRPVDHRNLYVRFHTSGDGAGPCRPAAGDKLRGKFVSARQDPAAARAVSLTVTDCQGWQGSALPRGRVYPERERLREGHRNRQTAGRAGRRVTGWRNPLAPRTNATYFRSDRAPPCAVAPSSPWPARHIRSLLAKTLRRGHTGGKGERELTASPLSPWPASADAPPHAYAFHACPSPGRSG